jgi:hypothetical protein
MGRLPGLPRHSSRSPDSSRHRLKRQWEGRAPFVRVSAQWRRQVRVRSSLRRMVDLGCMVEHDDADDDAQAGWRVEDGRVGRRSTAKQKRHRSVHGGAGGS